MKHESNVETDIKRSRIKTELNRCVMTDSHDVSHNRFSLRNFECFDSGARLAAPVCCVVSSTSAREITLLKTYDGVDCEVVRQSPHSAQQKRCMTSRYINSLLTLTFVVKLCKCLIPSQTKYKRTNGQRDTSLCQFVSLSDCPLCLPGATILYGGTRRKCFI